MYIDRVLLNWHPSFALVVTKVAKVLLEFGADSSAKDCNGAFPDGVIGAASPDAVDPACARELSEVVVGHRLRIKGGKSCSTSRSGIAYREQSHAAWFIPNRRVYLPAMNERCSTEVEVRAEPTTALAVPRGDASTALFYLLCVVHDCLENSSPCVRIGATSAAR